MKPQYTALVGRIIQALVDIERVVNRAELLLNKARQNGDDGYLDGVALNLHSFYTGIEAIFEDIARNVEGTIPSGTSWHQELLLQMSAELGSLRPAVISSETRYCLDEYRGFRHVVRNVYSFNLRSGRLEQLSEEVHPCYEAVKQDLIHFTQFLEQVSL
ncbi:MAG: hypothetical protein NT075_26280 [Chloroflexi bacterium]|nr:hypothetical protein [Chloroflexota bacterium]